MHWKKSASLINSAVVQLESRSFQLGFLLLLIFFTSFEKCNLLSYLMAEKYSLRIVDAQKLHNL